MKRYIFLAVLILLLGNTSYATDSYVTNGSTKVNNQYLESKNTLIRPIDKFIQHFVWGADIGSSIDMSGNDMSSIDIDAYFGYKNSFIRTLGVGASIHTALGNSNMAIPVYLIFRSSFRSQPSLCFLDLRAGYSFNSISSSYNQSGAYGSIGVGFNLSFSKKFNSHIILAYNFIQLKPYGEGENYVDLNNLSAMAVKIGVSF
ncbi:MAG: hypothetical protein RSC87_06330 [Muribaculaceae bacterium]